MEENKAVQNDTVTNEPMDNASEQPVEKTFSQKEVDELLQAETDRRVNEALAKSKTKWQKELEAKMAEEKRLSQLSAEERQREIAKQEAEKFQAERDAFEKERAEFARQKMQMELIKELETEGLPSSFSNFLLGVDSESTFANLQAFKAEYQSSLQKAVEQHVQEALRGNAPASATNSNKTMSRKEFLNLPARQRTQMVQENPELVQEILNGK